LQHLNCSIANVEDLDVSNTDILIPCGEYIIISSDILQVTWDISEMTPMGSVVTKFTESDITALATKVDQEASRYHGQKNQVLQRDRVCLMSGGALHVELGLIFAHAWSQDTSNRMGRLD
jgi:hypothetical protein